jgi:glutathione S-transferase
MLDDGTPLPESTVILAYLDEKFPATPLLPASPEGRALERLTAGLGRVERFLAPQGFDAGPAFGQADCVLPSSPPTSAA